jgi:hypothetical protein
VKLRVINVDNARSAAIKQNKAVLFVSNPLVESVKNDASRTFIVNHDSTVIIRKQMFNKKKGMLVYEIKYLKI